jgi:hypothetical protein
VDVDEVTSSQPPVRRPNRRTGRLTGVLVLSLIVATGIVIVVLTGKGSPPPTPEARQFDDASKVFHTQFDTHSAALNAHLLQAGDAVQDAGFVVAVGDAKALARDYQTYAAAVKAIGMPSAAWPGQARIEQDASAGDFLMTQAAASSSKTGMQATLNADWPQVKADLADAEANLRSTLGFPG